MNENVDLTKILKNCPEGWEFYSSIYGDVIFSKITDDSNHPIAFLTIRKDGGEKGCGTVTKEGLCMYCYNGECTFFPSREQRDWSKFTAPWLKKERFDPKTLQPFDRVIARDSVDRVWKCDLFSHIKDGTYYPYRCVGCSYINCIPYNDNTKHLVGTDDEAPEYYKYWED